MDMNSRSLIQNQPKINLISLLYYPPHEVLLAKHKLKLNKTIQRTPQKSLKKEA